MFNKQFFFVLILSLLGITLRTEAACSNGSCSVNNNSSIVTAVKAKYLQGKRKVANRVNRIRTNTKKQGYKNCKGGSCSAKRNKTNVRRGCCK